MNKLFILFNTILVFIFVYCSSIIFNEKGIFAIYSGIPEQYNVFIVLTGMLNYIIPLMFSFDNNKYLKVNNAAFLIPRSKSKNRLLLFIIKRTLIIGLTYEILKLFFIFIVTGNLSFDLDKLLICLLLSFIFTLIILFLQIILETLYDGKLAVFIMICTIIILIPLSNLLLHLNDKILQLISPYNIVMLSRHVKISDFNMMNGLLAFLYLLTILICEIVFFRKKLNKKDWI